MFGRLKNNLLLVIAIVPCSVVLAASFDCTKTRTHVEKLFGSTPEFTLNVGKFTRAAKEKLVRSMSPKTTH